MFCKNCGHEDLSGAAFCPKCGEKLEESTVQAAPVSVAAPAPKKNTAKIIIIGAVIVALLAGAGVVTYFGFFAENPWFVSDKADDGDDKKKEEKKDKEEDEEDGEKASREVVEKYLDAAKEYDYKEAAKYIDIDADEDILERDERDELEEWKAFFMGMAELGDETYAEEAADIMAKTVVESFDYEIKDCKKDGDNYVYTIETKQISGTDVADALRAIDKQALQTEAYGMLVEEGIVTGDEDEFTDEQLEEFIARRDALIIEAIEEACADLEPEEREDELTVIKKDGEWLVHIDE